MASTTVKKPCVKCSKGGGIFTCDGCQQSFCRKHSDEHRQELATEMDQVGQEHDLLQRDLTRETGTHPLMVRIDQWEQESITKIQVAAEAARADVQELIDRTKSDLKRSINKMTDELQSSQQSDDYTELDLAKWIEQLKEFRKTIENPTNIRIVTDDNTSSSIHLIKVMDHQRTRPPARTVPAKQRSAHISPEPIPLAHERFDNINENIELSEQELVATYLVGTAVHQGVYGINRYSSGTHHIRFLVVHKLMTYYLFFGIITSSEKVALMGMSTPSIYGWRDLDFMYMNGQGEQLSKKKVLCSGDEVALTLDCDNRQLRFEHHRTKTHKNLFVDLETCPFPWKVLVVLFNQGDCVRILR